MGGSDTNFDADARGIAELRSLLPKIIQALTPTAPGEGDDR